MFYRPKEGHGLPHNPFNAIVAPRPIGWISSVDSLGNVNLAPYSFFNAVAYEPPQVMYASTGQHLEGGLKDTAHNIEQTGEFVVNIVTADLMESMNASSASAPRDIDEFSIAELEKAPSVLVKPPRVAQSPIQLECVHTQTVSLKTTDPTQENRVIFGEVVGVHIDEAVLTNGLIDIAKLRPLSRLGYMDYGIVDNSFTLQRPAWPEKK